MTNNERIDAYFNNELTEADRQQLMQDIDSDPSLKADFQFQEGVIDGIKDFRKKELMARLDNIQVASVGQSILLKSIGIIGIASVVTVGTYMWLNSTEEQPLSTEDPVNTEQLIAAPEETMAEDADEVDTGILVEDEKTEDKIAGKIVEADPGAESTREASDTDTPAATPAIVIPEVQEPESETSVSVDEDLSAPEAMSSSAIRLRSSTDVEVRLSKKYSFHYQVKNGALVLFGNFNDSPFEVIELKTNKGINSYLYFEDNFYALVNNSTEVKPLLVLKNEQLIKELEKRR